MEVTTIDILRHGQTEADDILRGRIDVALSEQGYQQMQQRVDTYIDSSFPWQQLVTSPLQRCARFTEELAAQHNTAITVDEGFLEMDFGDWDGRPFHELRDENPELFTKIWREPHKHCPPNAESFAEFSERISSAWDNLVEQYYGKHILLVCHGGVIRALLGYIMQTPLSSLSRIEVPFACMSRVKIHHEQEKDHWPQLVFHNPH